MRYCALLWPTSGPRCRVSRVFYDMTLHLEDVRDLFSTPAPDPFSANVRYTSGIDEVITILKPTVLRKKTRATLYLPLEQDAPDTTRRLTDAVRRYCLARIADKKNDMASLRWQGLKALQSGMPFLAVCLFVSTFAEGSNALPELAKRVLGEGFLIAGWVALFHPIELLIYDWWPHNRQIHLYQNLMNMEIVVKAETQ
jgi:hypothetical protein